MDNTEAVDNLKAKRRAEDAKFISEQDNWPNWPVLTIKRYVNNQMDCAFIYALGYEPPKQEVIFENVFRFSGMTVEQRMACRREVYDTIEALLDDGWMVD